MTGFDTNGFVQMLDRITEENDKTDSERMLEENFITATGHCHGWVCSCFVEGFMFDDTGRAPRRRRDQ